MTLHSRIPEFVKALIVLAFRDRALVFNNMLETIFIQRMEQNEEVFARYMNDLAFQKVITKWLSDEVYRRLVGVASPVYGER
jgi:hypothetical protein